MTDSVSFHWLKPVAAITLVLILWRIFLLIMPISDLDGFMSLHVGLLSKFGLWSFNVTNESFSANASILLSRSSFLAIFFSSDIILSAEFGWSNV